MPLLPATFTSSIAQSRTNATVSASTTTRDAHTIIEMEGSSQTIAEILTEHVNTPNGHIAQLPMNDVMQGLTSLANELDNVLTEETANAPASTQELVVTIESLMRGDSDAVNPSYEYITLNIDDPSLFENSRHSQETSLFVQRAQAIVDSLGELLGKLGRNEFEGDLGRWASNLTISGVRTGLVIGTLTTIRQLIGFAVEKTLQSNATSPLTRNVIGAIALTIGPALNILGAIRDECNGTANQQTRLARLATLTLSIAALASAAAVPSALPALASFGSQMAFYSFAQDLVNLFCPISDNAKTNPGGTAATGVLNGALQFLSFTGMNYTAPHSGPGYVMAQSNKSPPSETEGFAYQLSIWLQHQADAVPDANLSVETRANEIVESLVPVLGHDALRGAYNAGADVAGQVFGGELMHHFQANSSDKGFRINPISVRMPTAEQVANQFLSTNAIRTSMGETIIAVVLAGTRYFTTLPISKAEVDHIVNTMVAIVVFAGRPGTMYVNERTKPA